MFRWAAISCLVACKFASELAPGDPTTDAPPDTTDTPNGCATVDATCDGDVLRGCLATGQSPVEITCNWGCLASTAPARCAAVQPTGGAVTSADATSPITGGAPITLAAATTMDTTTGELTGGITRPPNTDPAAVEVLAGIEFSVRNGVGVFRFESLAVNARLAIDGDNAVAIVSRRDVQITAEIDARGDCGGTNAGPGARRGSANENVDAAAPGGGQSPKADTSSSDRPAGGGGAHGANGGNGGDGAGGPPSIPGGTSFGDPEISMIAAAGGAGGGAGGGDNDLGGAGGGGGGALQIVADGLVQISAGGINAGGCGGKGGGAAEAGGGGGSGGAILIEAARVEIAAGAGIAANGGGGGGGNGVGPGENGPLSITVALGGGAGMASAGGNGGGGSQLAGRNGANDDFSGGGGGGVGRIRVRTRAGTLAVSDGFASPPLTTMAGAAGRVLQATFERDP